MRCPAVVKIVAIDGSNDGMSEPEFFDRFADTDGLGRIERVRKAGLDIAESAGARAGVAHDHEGCVFFSPALADVGAAGLLADGYEPMFLDNFLRRGPLRRARRLDPDPFGFSRHRLVGPMRLFRVAPFFCLDLLVFEQIGTRSHASSY